MHTHDHHDHGCRTTACYKNVLVLNLQSQLLVYNKKHVAGMIASLMQRRGNMGEKEDNLCTGSEHLKQPLWVLRACIAPVWTICVAKELHVFCHNINLQTRRQKKKGAQNSFQTSRSLAFQVEHRYLVESKNERQKQGCTFEALKEPIAIAQCKTHLHKDALSERQMNPLVFYVLKSKSSIACEPCLSQSATQTENIEFYLPQGSQPRIAILALVDWWTEESTSMPMQTLQGMDMHKPIKLKKHTGCEHQ